jgi:hypothetical protein
MKPAPAILNELKELSPLLAEMDRVNVFTVPGGYFESLEILLMAGIDAPGTRLEQNIGMPANQSVPEGYFDGLADSILAKVKALELSSTDEIRELSPALAGMQHKNVFTVPVGYFDAFAGTLAVQLSTKELSAAEEIRALSPMLYSIQGENVFSVPRGYFENLAGEISEKLNPVPAKVVTMRKRSNTFLKYAVAAAFTGVMALGIFKFSDNKRVVLDDTVVAGLQIAKENKVEEEINKLTDADIVNYLKSNGENIDMAAVTNLVDEKKLPEQTDYLMDDKTLDNYLDNISLDDLKN